MKRGLAPAASHAAGANTDDHAQLEDGAPKKQRPLDADDIAHDQPQIPLCVPQRKAAQKAEARMLTGGQPQQAAPALPPAVPGHHPIGLGPWGHEPSTNVKLPKQPKPHLPHQSMYGYEKDPAMVQRRQELAKQIREELGPKTLKRHFQTDMSFGVEEVDMVLALPCMRGARVAVNCSPIGGHHSGTLEHNGERVRCDQCMGEVEAKRQQVLAGDWGSDEEEEGEAWDEEEALRRASMDRTTFMGHCCGPSEGQRKHPDVLELVDVRLSLRELCVFVSHKVDASLWFCIYCRADRYISGKLQPVHTCASCPAAFHRPCYNIHTKQVVGEGLDWCCASCAGGHQVGVAAGDGIAVNVGGTRGTAARTRQRPPAARAKAAAGPQPHNTAPQQQQQKQQQQEQQQQQQQPLDLDDDALDLILNMPVSSDSGSQLSHSSMSSGHQVHGGDEEEVVSSPASAAPAAPQQLPLPPPGGGAGSGAGLAPAGTKAPPGPSRMPAGQPGPADPVAEVRQGLGLGSAAVDGRGSKKPAAEQRKVLQAGAMSAAGGSPGPPGPPPQQLGGMQSHAPSAFEHYKQQQQAQEQEETTDSNDEEEAQVFPRKRPAPLSKPDQRGTAAATAAAARKQKKPQQQPRPRPPPTGGAVGGGLRRQLLAAALLPPQQQQQQQQQQQAPDAGAQGPGPGPAHTHASKPHLPQQPQQRRKQREGAPQKGAPRAAAAGAVAAAAAVPAPRQLWPASSSSAGGGGQPPVLKRLCLTVLRPPSPLLDKGPGPKSPAAAEEGGAADADAANHDSEHKEGGVSPPASAGAMPHAAEAPPGPDPSITHRNTDAAAAAAAAAQEPAPRQPPLPPAAAAILRHRGSKQERPARRLPVTRGAGAAAAGVSPPAAGGLSDSDEEDLAPRLTRSGRGARAGVSGPPAQAALPQQQGDEQEEGGRGGAGGGKHPGGVPCLQPLPPAPLSRAASSRRAASKRQKQQQGSNNTMAAPAASGGPDGGSPSGVSAARAAFLQQFVAQQQEKHPAAVLQQLVDKKRRSANEQRFLEHLLVTHQASLPGVLVDAALAALGYPVPPAAGDAAGGVVPPAADGITLESLTQLAKDSRRPRSKRPFQGQRQRQQQQQPGPWQQQQQLHQEQAEGVAAGPVPAQALAGGGPPLQGNPPPAVPPVEGPAEPAAAAACATGQQVAPAPTGAHGGMQRPALGSQAMSGSAGSAGAAAGRLLHPVSSAAAAPGAGGRQVGGGAGSLPSLAAWLPVQQPQQQPQQQRQAGSIRSQTPQVSFLQLLPPGPMGVVGTAPSPLPQGGLVGESARPAAAGGAAGAMERLLHQQPWPAGQQVDQLAVGGLPGAPAERGGPGHVQGTALPPAAPLPVPADMSSLLAAAFRVGQEVRSQLPSQDAGGDGDAGEQQLQPHVLLRGMAWQAAQAIAAGAARQQHPAPSASAAALLAPGDYWHQQQDDQPQQQQQRRAAAVVVPAPGVPGFQLPGYGAAASGPSPAGRQVGSPSVMLSGLPLAPPAPHTLPGAAAAAGGLVPMLRAPAIKTMPPMAAASVGVTGGAAAAAAASGAATLHGTHGQLGLGMGSGAGGNNSSVQGGAPGGWTPTPPPAGQGYLSPSSWLQPADAARRSSGGSAMLVLSPPAPLPGMGAAGPSPLLPAVPPLPPPAGALPAATDGGVQGGLAPADPANELQPGLAAPPADAAPGAAVGGGAGGGQTESSEDEVQPWEDLGYLLAAAAAKGLVPADAASAGGGTGQ